MNTTSCQMRGSGAAGPIHQLLIPKKEEKEVPEMKHLIKMESAKSHRCTLTQGLVHTL